MYYLAVIKPSSITAKLGSQLLLFASHVERLGEILQVLQCFPLHEATSAAHLPAALQPLPVLPEGHCWDTARPHHRETWPSPTPLSWRGITQSIFTFDGQDGVHYKWKRGAAQPAWAAPGSRRLRSRAVGGQMCVGWLCKAMLKIQARQTPVLGMLRVGFKIPPTWGTAGGFSALLSPPAGAHQCCFRHLQRRW